MSNQSISKLSKSFERARISVPRVSFLPFLAIDKVFFSFDVPLALDGDASPVSSSACSLSGDTVALDFTDLLSLIFAGD